MKDDPMITVRIPRSLRDRVKVMVAQRLRRQAAALRRERIIEALRRGEAQKAIAAMEGVSHVYVCQLATRAGLRQLGARRSAASAPSTWPQMAPQAFR